MRERIRAPRLLPRTVLKDAIALNRTDVAQGLAICPDCRCH